MKRIQLNYIGVLAVLCLLLSCEKISIPSLQTITVEPAITSLHCICPVPSQKVTEMAFCYSTSSYNLEKGKANMVPGTKSGSEYTADITGLSPYTTYYVVAYATNSEGTDYSDVVKVQTLSQVPQEEENPYPDL